MVEVDNEIFKHYKEMCRTLSQITNGVIIRNKTISKAGVNSAVIFVPRYLLGQKMKVILIPENTEVAGLTKTIDKKSRLMQKNRIEMDKLKDEIKKHKSDLGDVSPESEPEVEKKDGSLEEDDAY